MKYENEVCLTDDIINTVRKCATQVVTKVKYDGKKTMFKSLCGQIGQMV